MTHGNNKNKNYYGILIHGGINKKITNINQSEETIKKYLRDSISDGFNLLKKTIVQLMLLKHQ